MVLIHEAGHYVAAKIFKFKVVEFSVGFGPKLFQRKRKNGELFSIRLLPLGGYCSFETEDENGVETEKSFYKEKAWKRIIVLVFGALFNIGSAVIFSFLFLLIVGTASTSAVRIDTVFNNANEVPYNAFLVGDVITHINDIEISTDPSSDFTIANLTGGMQAGEIADFTIIRNRETIVVSAVRTWISDTPFDGFGFTYRMNEDGEARVGAVTQMMHGVLANDLLRPVVDASGVAISYDTIVAINGEPLNGRSIASLTQGTRVGDPAVEFKVRRTVGDNYEYLSFFIPKMPITPAFLGFGFTQGSHMNRTFVNAIVNCVPFTGQMAWAVMRAFGGMFSGSLPAYYMAGPVGTIGQMATLTQTNWRNIFILFPLLSANLALFNLLPLPALDGGRIVFTTIEAIRKKPVPRKIEGIIHFVGMIVLLVVAVSLDFVGCFTRRGPTGWIRV